jgi:hypothetical protein
MGGYRAAERDAEGGDGAEIAVGESVFECPSSLNVVKDIYIYIYTIIDVIERVRIIIST